MVSSVFSVICRGGPLCPPNPKVPFGRATTVGCPYSMPLHLLTGGAGLTGSRAAQFLIECRRAR
ncbi:MAG: hypothetical protein ACOX7C_05480 [Brevefilum sp.]